MPASLPLGRHFLMTHSNLSLVTMLDITTPRLTVDCAMFWEDEIVLIRRGSQPFMNCLALPGGFVDVGETVERACVREVREEVGVQLRESDLRLVGVYSSPRRDPRFHTVSIAFLAVSFDAQYLEAGDDAASVHLLKEWKSKDLAFDHRTIIEDASQLLVPQLK